MAAADRPESAPARSAPRRNPSEGAAAISLLRKPAAPQISIAGASRGADDEGAMLACLARACGLSLRCGPGPEAAEGPLRLTLETLSEAGSGSAVGAGSSTLELRPIRGLPGVAKAHCPHLETLLVGVPVGIPASDLEACREALRVERGAPVAEVFTGAQDDADALAELVEELTLAARPPRTILVGPDWLSPLEAMLLALTGSAAFGVRVHRSPRGITVSAAREQADPAWLVRALVILLAEAGMDQRARQLGDAWLCTLEDGLHAATLPLLNPYARRLDGDRFVAAVVERLGRRPRRLAPEQRCPGLRVAASAGRASIRLVPSPA